MEVIIQILPPPKYLLSYSMKSICANIPFAIFHKRIKSLFYLFSPICPQKNNTFSKQTKTWSWIGGRFMYQVHKSTLEFRIDDKSV